MNDFPHYVPRQRVTRAPVQIASYSNEPVSSRWSQAGPGRLRTNPPYKIARDVSRVFRPPTAVRIFIGVGMLMVPAGVVALQPAVIFLAIFLVIFGMAIHGRSLSSWIDTYSRAADPIADPNTLTGQFQIHPGASTFRGLSEREAIRPEPFYPVRSEGLRMVDTGCGRDV